RRARGAQMPLRHARRDPARDQARPDRARVGGAMDRREFLKTSGALVVSFSLPAMEACAQNADKPALVPNELDSWIAVLPDGRVNAFFGKMDMGQGLDVAVAQIVAEELDVGFDKVSVLMGDTASSCNQGGASGSTGTSNGARLLRKAAAEARRVLVERAADRLGSPAAELRVEDGTVVSPRGKTTYAELVGGRVVREKDFVAVVAPREWDAVRAAQQLKIDWHYDAKAFPPMDALHEHIRAAKAVKREEPVKQGDVEAALKAPGVRVIEAEY